MYCFVITSKKWEKLNSFKKSRKCRSTHRAVAPVIATLLMVAIAVVGGSIIFVFSQGFFNQAQISGTPAIESVRILGYDARDIDLLDAHDGLTMTADSGDPTIQGKNVGERIVVYIQNDSVNQILFSEIRLGGTVYAYQTSVTIPDYPATTAGSYTIMSNSTAILQDLVGSAAAGQTVGFLIDLNDNLPIGRDTQFKLTTTNGAVFVGTVVMGQNTG